MRCPSCGRTAVPTGPYCPVCGRQVLAPLRWVASPPPSALPPPPGPPRAPYQGAPRYGFIPRWGFAPRPWTPPGERTAPLDALSATRSLTGSVVPLLWATALIALVAAGAEAWRYVLLLMSRSDALTAQAVAASDALVAAAGTVAPILAALSGAILIMWTLRAAQAAADRSGVRPARSPRAIVLGWLVPGLNLAVPGSVLAEIEHAVLDRPTDARPRPSRLLLSWWLLWAAGGVLAAVVLAWSFRSGVQALADGVVLHCVLDLLAAVTAAVTAVLVVRITRLLGPFHNVRREVVVAVVAPAAS